MKSTIKRDTSNSQLEIRHCKKAIESFEEALEHVVPHKKRKRYRTWMLLAMDRLCRNEPLPKAEFCSEGNLPGNAGKFYAFKHIPVRAYCWYSKRFDSVMYISHYIYKDFEKLDKADIKRVHANYNRIEVDGDDE